MIVNDIRNRAAARPNDTAVIHNDRSYSYLDFANSILGMVQILERENLPRKAVAIVVIKDIYLSWIVVSALRFLGLDTITAHSLTQAYALGIRSAALAVTTEEEDHPPPTPEVITVARRLIAISGQRAVNSTSDRSGEYPVGADACGGHILYTSGTTGHYKKAFYERDKSERICDRVADRFGLTPDTRFHDMNFPLFTAAGFFYPMAVWRTGGCVVFDQTGSGPKNILKHDIPMAFVIPSMLDEIVRGMIAPVEKPENLTVCVTGGFLPAHLVEAVRSKLTSRIKYYYGATECLDILRSDVKDEDQLHWFEPADWRVVRVLKTDGRECRPGEEGELAVGLTDVDCTGYLGDPETSRKFFRNGYFFPGDLAVKRSDGRIKILGRISDVLNVAGNKIAVAPFELRVQQLLGASAVCIFSGLDGTGNTEVIVAVETRSIPTSMQMQAIAALLGKFEQVRVEVLPRFPRTNTAMAKVDRQKLRALVSHDRPLARS